MTPAEPIRPVGGVSSEELAVRRAAEIARIMRHRHHEDDEQARDQRRREDQHHEQLDAARGSIWTTKPIVDPARLAGAYDDHGRTGELPEAPAQRHLDASA